jgi:signal transduction histidine kinase
MKRESVGILAGGIAHDFNNLITVIIGNLSMVKDDLEEGTEESAILETAENTSSQAADLAQKLVVFSRGDWMSNQRITLRETLDEISKNYPEFQPLLNRISLARDLKPIDGDSRQLRQVMISLLQNANEATGDNKIVTIKAENVSFSASNDFSLQPGDYNRISVSDNGVGIGPADIGNIFDPYFSTKGSAGGNGMGLGLAICQSIVKNHNGHISVESRQGSGTVFTFYLPAYSS